MKSQQIQLLKDIRSVLSYHQALGLEGYPHVDKNALHGTLRTFGRSSSEKPEQAKGKEFFQKSEIAEARVEAEVPGGSILEIEEEVTLCTSCNLHEKRIIPVPGRAGKRVRIFFVGGWLSVGGNKQLPKGTVFGVEEDLMIDRMLKAIGLGEKDAFVTNVIKCGIEESVQPKGENIDACSSFLHRQIAAVSPEIICTMGIIATRVFLSISRPLSQLRGRFHTHVTSTKMEIPLLATYHPTFLLQNPEMKRATWVDLQLMEKRLKLKGGE